MKRFQYLGSSLAGAAAGTVNGLFGTGGGMILIPLLTHLTPLEGQDLFHNSVAVILPVSLVTLGITATHTPLPWSQALLWMAGSGIGGIAAGLLGKKIPVKWLHRVLGLFILYGGIRLLWP